MIRRPPRSTLFSLHDAPPISPPGHPSRRVADEWGSPLVVDTPRLAESWWNRACCSRRIRSEEHTSELQSQSNLVCRLLLEKKKSKSDYKISMIMMTSTYNSQQ